jgi:hypothetical protein
LYKVYWTEEDEIRSELFGSDKMTEALNKMADLREIQYGMGGVSFIGMVSENPNMVGQQGVSDPSPDYNWTKRRSTALRKDVQ